MKSSCLAACMALLLATACLDFEKQTMTACYYPKTDTMVILQNYEGIFGDDLGDEPSEREFDELNSVLNGRATFFFDNFGAVYDADHLAEFIVEMKAELAKGNSELDGAIVERQIGLIKLLLANVKIESGPFYMKEKNLLCGVQRVTVRNVKKIVETVNISLRDLILSEPNDGDLDDESWAFLRKSAARGEDLLLIKGNQMQMRLPMTARGYRQVFLAKDDPVGEKLTRLGIHLAHAGQLATLTIGKPGASQMVLSGKKKNEEKYVPNMVREVRARIGLEEGFDLPKYTREFFSACDKKYGGKR
jgi:hypothetical protein